MDLCRYKHVFGKEGEGFHSVRLFDIAILDVIATLVVAVVIARLLKWNVFWTILAAFVLGIFAHRIFCVNTIINKFIFKTEYS